MQTNKAFTLLNPFTIKSDKHFVKIALIFVAVLAAIFFIFYFSLFNIWQEKLFDKFFTRKNASSHIVIFAIDNESIGALGQWPWSRQVFAKALAKLQTASAVAIDVNFSEPSKTDPAGDGAFSNAIKNSIPKVILPIQINPLTKEEVKPLEIFAQKSLIGKVNVINEDGTIRKVNNSENGIFSFGALAALQYKNSVSFPAAMRIDYAGPEKTFITLPINDLLTGNIPESIYRGNLVFIGATAPDLHDSFQTPFGSMPGVEIHANIANTILAQTFYSELPFIFSLLLILLCNLLAAGLILKIKRFSWLVASLTAVLILINLAGIFLFSHHIIIPVLYMDFGFIITSAALVIFQYITESKEKKFIHDSFKYYLAPDVIQEIIADPSKLTLGGQRKKITILFSDIRGFTSISETMTPETLAHVLNEYLTEMTDIIMDRKGLVDKYIGDAVMAFWGAPLANTNQAEDACRAAISMIEKLQHQNEHWKSSGSISKELEIGIGINTGDVVVGNFGSKKRFNYTVLGDEVNLAARLEGLNKTYGSHIIITESTKKEVEHNAEFNIRELDTIIVKGKKEPKIIFELMEKALPKDILDHFQTGRKLYKEGKFKEAAEQFSFSMDTDFASKMYIERCKEFENNPPQNWSGVYEFKTK